jgi:hypothetical protein
MINSLLLSELFFRRKEGLIKKGNHEGREEMQRARRGFGMLGVFLTLYILRVFAVLAFFIPIEKPTFCVIVECWFLYVNK